MSRRFTRGTDTDKALSIEELRHMARRRLPAFVFEYLDGGVEDEVTLRRNRDAFERIEFVPRALAKAGSVDMSATLLGQASVLPLAIAPTGFNGLFARNGDLCLARVAASAGIPFIQSTVSNASMKEVSAVPGLRHWMQIYVFRSRSFMEGLIERALTANCEALVLTCDANVFGNREWDKRNYRRGTDPTFRNKLETLLHPRWTMEVLARGMPPFGNLVDILPPGQRDFASAATWSRDEIDPDLDWECLAWIRSLWPRKLIMKGVLDMKDAERALHAGVDGIVLSNHGGRQLDGTISPLSMLAPIASRFRDRMTILIDSGFRRGTDVVKALALGADGVLLGRAILYGLAAGGEKGASRALTIITTEMKRALALLGRPSLATLDETCLLSGSSFVGEDDATKKI